jgi:TonB family protein
MVTAFPDLVVNLVKVRQPPPVSEDPAPLVKLSVQVLEISRSKTDKLGVSWSKGMTFTNPEVTDVSARRALRFGTSLTRSSFAQTLNALIQDNKARVLSEPTLVTASGKEASSFIGVEVPVIQATSIGTQAQSVNASITFRETGVLLKMTPTVVDTDQFKKITTVVQAEVSDLDKSVGLSVPVGNQTIVVPGFKVRKTYTEVTTASGETIVIAGLLELKDSHVVDALPGLSTLPVLGRLFRSPEISDTRNELVITVTPELLGDEANDAERSLLLEQAMAVAEVTASVDDPRLRYALQIQDRIAKALRYPQREKELNIEGTVKLRLHLFADGTLGRAVVTESSGIEALDLEAVKAAESRGPYPGFPTQMAERELWLDVPVIFRP